MARPIPDDDPVTITELSIKATLSCLGKLTAMGVAFVAHCLLNQNAKTDGGARCPGVYSPAVQVLRDAGWRIEQMPCPELAFTGLNRFWAVNASSWPRTLPT